MKKLEDNRDLSYPPIDMYVYEIALEEVRSKGHSLKDSRTWKLIDETAIEIAHEMYEFQMRL